LRSRYLHPRGFPPSKGVLPDLLDSLGLPAGLWSLQVMPGKAPVDGKAKKPAKSIGTESQFNRLSLLLTLVAGLFFTGAV